MAFDDAALSLSLGPQRAQRYAQALPLALAQRLAEGGITMNCQIVCCPGYNDGEALQKTMEDLAALYPEVNSVSIVPVGLTEHREHLAKL